MVVVVWKEGAGRSSPAAWARRSSSCRDSPDAIRSCTALADSALVFARKLSPDVNSTPTKYTASELPSGTKGSSQSSVVKSAVATSSTSTLVSPGWAASRLQRHGGARRVRGSVVLRTVAPRPLSGRAQLFPCNRHNWPLSIVLSSVSSDVAPTRSSSHGPLERGNYFLSAARENEARRRSEGAANDELRSSGRELLPGPR